MFNTCEHYIWLSGQDQELAKKKIEFKLEDQRLNPGKYSWKEKSVLKTRDRITDGIRAEIAVARYLRMDWNLEHELDDIRGSDLEFGIEVKGTSIPEGNLYCSDNTLGHYIKRSRSIPVVLARVGFWPMVEFPGWIMSGEISKYPFQNQLAKHNRGYLVPVNKLKSMVELEDLMIYWKKHHSRGKYDLPS